MTFPNRLLEEATLHLEELIDAAVRGEEVIITAPDTTGERTVKLVAETTEEAVSRLPRFGSAKGLIHMREDFDDPLPDFDEYQ
jgi:antitoxin (DNA-binding transcriptional repressor) of toxin-antitoxin stability system